MTIKHVILATGLVFGATAATATAQDASCEPTDITLYFADGETTLSANAKAALEAELDRIDHCDVLNIDAYAVSNDKAAPISEASLSSARTAAALDAIYKAGVVVPVDHINVSYEREDTARAAIARKVEMTLVAEPRQPNS